MWNPSLISNTFYRMQDSSGHLNNNKITEFPWVVTILTGHAQHCHFAVTCPVMVGDVKTIAYAVFSPYQITQH